MIKKSETTLLIFPGMIGFSISGANGGGVVTVVMHTVHHTNISTYWNPVEYSFWNLIRQYFSSHTATATTNAIIATATTTNSKVERW